MPAAPKSPAQNAVHDSKGALVSNLSDVTARDGFNRVGWEICDRPLALRATLPENPHIWEEPRFENQSTRPVTHRGIARSVRCAGRVQHQDCPRQANPLETDANRVAAECAQGATISAPCPTC